jgi:hypothetical protein
LFGSTTGIAIAAPKNPKKKYSLLPVLTVLFVISYSLMTMLIVEQGSVIQSQGSLIKTLMRDSVELWGMKGKFNADKIAKAQEQNSQQAPPTQAQVPARSPLAQTQVQSNQVQSNQVQSKQTPSTQVPSVQTPSTQGIQQHSSSRTGKLAKPATKAPPVPADDLVDHRRALVTI